MSDQHEGVWAQSASIWGMGNELTLALRGPVRVRIDYHPAPETIIDGTLAVVEVTGLHDALREAGRGSVAFLIGWLSHAIETALLTAHDSEPATFKTMGAIEACDD